ncbi:hypothetical protein EFBL_1869 [Effusibacillus lacus]|uniref:Uncharacterized protein n=2 Tax=Effusibacillus lacus TaxID=1348429 RepID=A0A292YNA7_9BACL|nr:hypothetical protein EFBL_1869 [Effusibacillus lacus]
MGNEMDKRIQGSGGQGSAGRKTARERMLELEQNLQEVKDQIQEYGQRLQTLEEQHRLLDERLCYLEAMHP